MGCMNGCNGNCNGRCGTHTHDPGQDPAAYSLWLASNNRQYASTAAIVSRSIDDYAASISVAGYPNACAAVRAVLGMLGESATREYLARIQQQVGGANIASYLEANCAMVIKAAATGFSNSVANYHKPCGQQQTVNDSLCAMLALCGRSYRSLFAGSSLIANGMQNPSASDVIVLYKDKPSTTYRELTSVGNLWSAAMLTPLLSSSVNFPLAPATIAGTLNDTFTFTNNTRDGFAIEIQYTAKKIDSRAQLPFSASTTGFKNDAGESLNASWEGHIIEPTGGFLYFMFGIDDGGNGDSGRAQKANKNSDPQSLNLKGFGPEWDLTGRFVQHGTGSFFRMINSLMGGGIIK